ncbi:hypothetical protein Tco_0868902 [Tanacetum coccineum]
MQLIQKLRDDKKCMKKVEPSSRSKAIEDIINIRSFVEALVLNHYVRIYQKSQEIRQKTGKHGHEKRKSTREAKDSKPKPMKVNSQSTMGQQSQLTKRQNLKMVQINLPSFKSYKNGPLNLKWALNPVGKKSKGQSTAKSKGQSTACLVWKSRSTAFNIGTLKD